MNSNMKKSQMTDEKEIKVRPRSMSELRSCLKNDVFKLLHTYVAWRKSDTLLNW